MRADAEIRVTDWRGTPTLDVFDGFHTGYERLPTPATHRRTIIFAKESPAWLVVDRVGCAGSVSCDSYLHLAPGGALSRPADVGPWGIDSIIDSLWTHAGGEGQMVARSDASVQFSRGGIDVGLIPVNADRFTVLTDWVSPRYGRRLPAPTLHLGGRADSVMGFGYLIVGRPHGA
jgi:hypothetical protein